MNIVKLKKEEIWTGLHISSASGKILVPKSAFETWQRKHFFSRCLHTECAQFCAFSDAILAVTGCFWTIFEKRWGHLNDVKLCFAMLLPTNAFGFKKKAIFIVDELLDMGHKCQRCWEWHMHDSFCFIKERTTHAGEDCFECGYKSKWMSTSENSEWFNVWILVPVIVSKSSWKLHSREATDFRFVLNLCINQFCYFLIFANQLQLKRRNQQDTATKN